jgi:hypothetical protein
MIKVMCQGCAFTHVKNPTQVVQFTQMIMLPEETVSTKDNLPDILPSLYDWAYQDLFNQDAVLSCTCSDCNRLPQTYSGEPSRRTAISSSRT